MQQCYFDIVEAGDGHSTVHELRERPVFETLISGNTCAHVICSVCRTGNREFCSIVDDWPFWIR